MFYLHQYASYFQVLHDFLLLLLQILELELEPLQLFHFLQLADLLTADVQLQHLYFFSENLVFFLPTQKLFVALLELGLPLVEGFLPGFVLLLHGLDLSLEFTDAFALLHLQSDVRLFQIGDLNIQLVDFCFVFFGLLGELLDCLLPGSEHLLPLVGLLSYRLIILS